MDEQYLKDLPKVNASAELNDRLMADIPFFDDIPEITSVLTEKTIAPTHSRENWVASLAMAASLGLGLIIGLGGYDQASQAVASLTGSAAETTIDSLGVFASYDSNLEQL